MWLEWGGQNSGIFDGINVDTAGGATFISCDTDLKFPFATIVTSDNDYDRASDLDRPLAFRLSIGVGKATYRSLFGRDADRDYTAMDRLMPHPCTGGSTGSACSTRAPRRSGQFGHCSPRRTSWPSAENAKRLSRR